MIYVDDTGCDIEVPYSDDNGDNLNYLAGKPLSFVREMAFRGTLAAHKDGGAPSMVLRMDKMDVRDFGGAALLLRAVLRHQRPRAGG